GLTLMPEQPPAWIATALGQLASVMLMLVMLAVGMTIQLRLPRDELGPLALGLSLKLVLLPALALGLALGFGLQGDMRQVAVLESAMPTMVTAAALAISHGLAPRLAAALVGYGIVLAMATLPAWRVVLDRLGGWGGPGGRSGLGRGRAGAAAGGGPGGLRDRAGDGHAAGLAVRAGPARELRRSGLKERLEPRPGGAARRRRWIAGSRLKPLLHGGRACRGRKNGTGP